MMINDGRQPYIWILKPPRKSVSSNLAFSQDMLLSDASCLKSVASLQLRLPQESTSPSQAHYDMGNWLNLGDHIFCNFNEENEVQSIGKGGVCPIFRQNHVVTCLYDFLGGLFSCPTPKNNPKRLHWFACMHLHPQIQPTSTNLRHCWPFQFCPWSGVSLRIKHAGHIPTSRIV